MVFNLKNRTSGTLAVNFFDLSGEEQTKLLGAQQKTSITGSALTPQTLALINIGQLAYSYDQSGGPPSTGTDTSLRFALTWNGPWTSQYQYTPGNVVSYSGNMWVCTVTHTSALAPNDDSDDWFQFSIFDPSTFLGLDPSSITNGSVVFANGGAFTAGLITAANISPSGIPESSVANLVSDLASKISRSGDTVTSPLSLNYTPSNSLHAVNKGWVTSNFVPSGGGAVTGPITYPNAPVGSTELVNKAYVDTVGVASVPLAGGTMSGALILNAAPTVALGAATKGYVDTSAVPVGGGAISGPITYAADPVGNNELVRKSWVLNQLSSGFTVAGNLYVNATPTSPTGAANKSYVDAQALAGGTLTGALSWATPPASANQLSNKAYVDGQVATRVPLAGGTITGPILYAADPAGDNELVRKSWVIAQLSGGSGGGGFLPLTGGTMTGSIALFPDTMGTATGLKYNPTLNAPAYGGQNIVTIGGIQSINTSYTITPNDGMIFANAAGGSFPVIFPTSLAGFGLQEVTIVKSDPNAYTQVYVQVNGVDNRDSNYVLSYPGESISLIPENGVWAVSRRFYPTIAGKSAAIAASVVAGPPDTATITVNISDRYQLWGAANIINSGGFIGINVPDGTMWQVGGQVEVQLSVHGYTGYYTIGSISGNTLITTSTAFTTTESGLLALGFVQPAAAQLCTVALALSTDPANPWAAPGNGARLKPLSSPSGGIGTFLGGSPQVPTLMTVNGGLLEVVIDPGTTPSGTVTWYVHVLSAGHDSTNGAGGQRGTLYGPVTTTVSSVSPYTASITGATTAGGGSQTTFALSGSNSGSPFNTGDVVTVAGAGPYSGSQTVVSATSTSVTLSVPYAGTVTSGTVISANAMSVGVTTTSGVTVGSQMTFNYATAINSAQSTTASVLQIGTGSVAIRGTYNSSGTTTGGASVAPICPVTFAI